MEYTDTKGNKINLNKEVDNLWVISQPDSSFTL